MTGSPYLERASELDAMAVGIGKTLIQSLTLIHGAALLAIPAFAKQFEVVLRPGIRTWLLICFTAGLVSVIGAGIFAFFALAQRSDENLELSKTAGATNSDTLRYLTNFKRLRWIAIGLIILSSACLIVAGWTSVSILVASDAMHPTGQ
jgi:hypothetical protein